MQLEYIPELKRIKVIPGSHMEQRGIKSYLTRYVDGYVHTPRFKMRLWDGKETEFHSETNTIPMGLWKEAYKCCQEFGYPFEFTNKKDFPLNRTIKREKLEAFYKEFFKDCKLPNGDPFELRDYQVTCAYNILRDRYCNISVATSGGKTLIYALVLFYLMSNEGKDWKFLLVVPSKTLVTQFYDDLLEFNVGMSGKNDMALDLNIQEVFDDTEKPRTTDPTCEPNLVIGTFQTLSNNDKFSKEWFKQFKSVTSDEGHRSGNKSYRKINKRMLKHSMYQWGMSGSFPDEKSYEMMRIMALTGPIVDKVKAKKLMDAGFITKVKIKGVLMHHNDWEFAEQLIHVASRDKKACYDLECEKIQQSEERLGVLSKIVSGFKANGLVLFHNTDYGQKILERLKEDHPDKEFYYIDGSVKNNGSKKNIENNRKFIKAEMEKTDKVRVLVASFGTLSTGVSIKAITYVVFTQSFKKAQVIIQSIGRALRLHPDKVMAYIFDMVDIFRTDSFAKRTRDKFKNVLETHWEKRQQIYLEEEYPCTQLELEFNGNN